MNSITLLGRLTKDPEIRYTPAGKAVCQFMLAVNRPFKGENGQQEADFIPVVLWGKTAELAGNSLLKGHRVLIEGRLQIRQYTAKDGSNRYVTEVIGNHMEFIELKGQQVGQQSQQGGFSDMGSQVPFDEQIPF